MVFKRAVLATLAAVVALSAVPSVAAAQGRIDGRPFNVLADGLGRLQVRLVQQESDPGLFFPSSSDLGNAGLEIKEGETYYPLGSSRTPVSAPTVTAEGAESTLTSVYGVGPNLQVTERITYTQFKRRFRVAYEITNVSGAPVSFNAGALADLYVGSDSGVSLLEPGPPRYLAGQKPETGLTFGLVEVTPWDRYQAGSYSLVFSNFGSQGLDNSVDGSDVDNGAGAEWIVTGLAPGATRTIEVEWLMRGNDLPNPVARQSVNLPGWKGEIRVRLPGAGSYTNLESIAQVPVGTTFDTRKGRLNVEAASDTSGGTNDGWFYDGIFKVGQTGGSRPVTTLKLTGGLQCGASASALAQTSARRKRRLWGNTSGRFRTRGRFSSATVRGTRWETIDRCDGTLTRVKRGKVTVRDFVRDRTVVVRRGDRYLARRP
jgi:hypothetical protein